MNTSTYNQQEVQQNANVQTQDTDDKLLENSRNAEDNQELKKLTEAAQELEYPKICVLEMHRYRHVINTTLYG